MSRSYVVSKGAAADIREITKYTVEKWGQAQCRAYIAELAIFHERMDIIARLRNRLL